MDLKCLYPFPSIEESNELVRSIRDIPPAHYIFKVESFSLLSEILSKTGVDKYESSLFEVGGYSWRLELYPDGNRKSNGHGHISLDLVLTEANMISPTSAVNVIFNFSVYDSVRNKYLSLHDSKVRSFHALKNKWGFPQLLPLETFKDASNGYLIDDCCAFGVEILVIKTPKGETLSITKEPSNSTCTWKLDNFSGLTQSYHYSPIYTVGGREWRLCLYPKGHSTETGKGLSIFLELNDYSKLQSGWKFFAEFKLCIRNQLFFANQHEITYKTWFHATVTDWGSLSFIPLSTLRDPLKGFIVNDTLIVEAKFITIAVLKNW